MRCRSISLLLSLLVLALVGPASVRPAHADVTWSVGTEPHSGAHQVSNGQATIWKSTMGLNNPITMSYISVLYGAPNPNIIHSQTLWFVGIPDDPNPAEDGYTPSAVGTDTFTFTPSTQGVYKITVEMYSTTYGHRSGSCYVTVETVPGIAYRPSTDFNGDGHNDLFWVNRTDKLLDVWNMNDTTVLNYGATFASSTDSNWQPVGVGDFNNDGHPDILWQNSSTLQLAIWHMNGTTRIDNGVVFTGSADPNWKVVGVGDFNQDGYADILWQYVGSGSLAGKLAVWNMQDSSVYNIPPTFSGQGAGWNVVGVADFNGDGLPDIVWQNASTSQVLVWHMSYYQMLDNPSIGITVNDPNWKVVGAGDTDGDGKPDLLWQYQTSNDLCRWQLNDTTVTSYGPTFATTSNLNWKVVGSY